MGGSGAVGEVGTVGDTGTVEEAGAVGQARAAAKTAVRQVAAAPYFWYHDGCLLVERKMHALLVGRHW